MMNPRVISNEAHNYLKLCPGDEEPQDFEEFFYKQVTRPRRRDAQVFQIQELFPALDTDINNQEAKAQDLDIIAKSQKPHYEEDVDLPKGPYYYPCQILAMAEIQAIIDQHNQPPQIKIFQPIEEASEE